MKKIILFLFCSILPVGAVILQYCDETPFSIYSDTSLWAAQRMTPPTGSGNIASIWVYIEANAVVSPPMLYYVHLGIFAFHLGQPGTLLWSSNDPYTTTFTGWKEFTVNYYWNGQGDTEFMVGAVPYCYSSGPNMAFCRLYQDIVRISPNRNWLGGLSEPVWYETTSDGDFMFKTDFGYDTAIQSTSLGQLKASFKY